MSTLIAIVVFGLALALDFATARYNIAVRELRAHAAARWSITMCVLSSLGVLAFVHEPWMLVAECAGLYAGTWLAVLRMTARTPKVETS